MLPMTGSGCLLTQMSHSKTAKESCTLPKANPVRVCNSVYPLVTSLSMSPVEIPHRTSAIKGNSAARDRPFAEVRTHGGKKCAPLADVRTPENLMSLWLRATALELQLPRASALRCSSKVCPCPNPPARTPWGLLPGRLRSFPRASHPAD
jgi:hypothetical protein